MKEKNNGYNQKKLENIKPKQKIPIISKKTTDPKPNKQS